MSRDDDQLSTLTLDRHDDVAIAISGSLQLGRAAVWARRLTRHLDDAEIPRHQRLWLIAANGSDEQSAALVAALSDVVGEDAIRLHNPHDPDALIFQRRLPGQRRGGIYLNADWQSASVRIAIGQPRAIVSGLSAWFNRDDQLRDEDLVASLVIG